MNKPKRILSLDNTFTFGGAINSLCYLYRAIDKTSFSPVVLSGQSQEFLNSKFPGCMCYHFIPKLPWINNKIYLKIASLSLFQNRFLLKILNAIRFLYWIAFITFPEALWYRKLVLRHKIDLIHLNNGFQNAGIMAAKITGTPCVSHLRGFLEDGIITRFAARFIDHHVAISTAVKDNLLQLGVPEDRITLVHDAIDKNEYRPGIAYDYLFDEFEVKPGNPFFGIFGRVVDWKGIRELLVASRKVFENIPDAKGFVVGDASDGDNEFFLAMQKLAGQLGIAHKIVFTGFREDVPAILALMTVVVHASVKPEPFGMVIIEGMAMEKPVIATRAGGPLDIVRHGDTGYLVNMGDTEAMGSALVSLLQNPSLCEAMGKRGRACVEEFFDKKRYADKMEGVFNRLIFPDRYADGKDSQQK